MVERKLNDLTQKARKTVKIDECEAFFDAQIKYEELVNLLTFDRIILKYRGSRQERQGEKGGGEGRV